MCVSESVHVGRTVGSGPRALVRRCETGAEKPALSRLPRGVRVVSSTRRQPALAIRAGRRVGPRPGGCARRLRFGSQDACSTHRSRRWVSVRCRHFCRDRRAGRSGGDRITRSPAASRAGHRCPGRHAVRTGAGHRHRAAGSTLRRPAAATGDGEVRRLARSTSRGTIPVRLGDFTITDQLGRTFHPTLVLGETPPPSTLTAGTTEPSGHCRDAHRRRAPVLGADTGTPFVSWDFIVEND